MFSAPPSSSAPPVLSTSKSGRQIKGKKVWEQAKGLSQIRPRGPTLEAAADDVQPTKKSKQTMVPTEDIDDRESQQQRILGAAYLLEEPPRTKD